MGVNGSSSDSQLFNQSEMRSGIIDGTLQVPAAEPLSGDDRPIPNFQRMPFHFAHGDEILQCCGLPDDQRIFNYRLLHAHRVVENSFGNMANRFGCLLTTMNQNKDTVTSIVLVCCVLHNIMRIPYPGVHHGIRNSEDEYHRLVHRQWRQVVNLHCMEEATAYNRDTQMAQKQRLYVKHYYNLPVGATAWQTDMVHTVLQHLVDYKYTIASV